MQGDDLQGKTPFEKGRWWRENVNVGEKTKHQLAAYLEEFSGDWGPSAKASFKRGYAGYSEIPWDKWRADVFKGY